MRASLISICGLMLLSSASVLAGSWTLPRGVVKDDGPRTYRWTVEYSTSSTTGHVIRRQLVAGNYTRGLPGGDSAWTDVSQIDSDGPDEPFAPPQEREIHGGFPFRPNPAGRSESLAPDFFKGFPPTAVFERNLVWDTQMIELYGQSQFEHLKLNQPYHLTSAQMNMPGVGTFRNRDVQLTWMGRSKHNG